AVAQDEAPSVPISGSIDDSTGEEPPDSVGISSSISSGPAPLSIRFELAASGGTLPPNGTYRWSFGDEVVHTSSARCDYVFTAPGNYGVAACVGSPSWPEEATRCATSIIVAQSGSPDAPIRRPLGFD